MYSCGREPNIETSMCCRIFLFLDSSDLKTSTPGLDNPTAFRTPNSNFTMLGAGYPLLGLIPTDLVPTPPDAKSKGFGNETFPKLDRRVENTIAKVLTC